MAIHLKPVAQQTIVITGATSGIGLATARLAAKKGARLFLTSRNKDDLRTLCEELRAQGTPCDYLAADVSEPGALERVAQECLETFGGFDTWVNNAAVSVYGKIEQTPIEDARKLFDTNFWGTVEGSRAAAKVLRRQGAGALINVGSVVSEVAIPLQGFYDASKHALRGFTDALRRELEMEKAPVSVTLVKPAAIDTPYTLHAKSLIDGEPHHQPPVYAPEVVARTILECATTPVREVGVGGSVRAYGFIDKVVPALQDVLLSKFMTEKAQRKQKGASDGRRAQGAQGQEALYGPAAHELDERGNYEGRVLENSIATKIDLALSKPMSTLPIVGAAVAAGAALYYFGTRAQEMDTGALKRNFNELMERLRAA